MVNFDTAFDRLMVNEGGYVNNPNDPGGETKYGISKRSYPDVDIANLTVDQAKAIYKRDFWDAGHMDMLDPDLAFQVFDFAVNSGIQTALRKLQKAAGVPEDGHIGPITLAAINRVKTAVLVIRFIAERLDYWTHLSHWNDFGRDWAMRAANDMRYAADDLENDDD